MEAIITTIIQYISPAALPLVIVVVAAIFFYFKFNSITKDRESTKIQRDNDSQTIHDDILKLKFKVTELDGRIVKHESIIEDMRQQLSELNANIVRLAVVVEELAKKIDNNKYELQSKELHTASNQTT